MPATAQKKDAAPYGVIAGTVFREPGFALPGAQITVTPNPEDGEARVKLKKVQVIANGRGEFAVRVPAARMRYTVQVAAKGYRRDEKSVTIQGEERVEATFRLGPESK